MTDYFAVQLPPEQIRSISSIGLAHIGDAVYELLVRTWLCAGGKATGRGLHRAAVALVCAPRQAELAEKIGVNRIRTCPGVRLTGPQHRKVKGVPFSLQAQNGQGRQEDDGRRSEQDQPQSTAGGPARYGGRPLTGGG